MIPEVDEILRGHAFYARRRVASPAHEGGVRAARKLAGTLSRDRMHDEPAAVLYAFTLVRHAFPQTWREMALVLAKNQASRVGRQWVADKDVRDLIVAVSEGNTSYEQVCLWMALHTKPIY